MVGWMSSIVFFPSLFMGVVLSPFIDRFGPIVSGVFVNAFNILVGILAPLTYHNKYLFLLVRFLSGVVDEPSWIVQATIINLYIPQKFETLAFGTCMAISTSAGLVGFFLVPVIMGDLEYG